MLQGEKVVVIFSPDNANLLLCCLTINKQGENMNIVYIYKQGKFFRVKMVFQNEKFYILPRVFKTKKEAEKEVTLHFLFIDESRKMIVRDFSMDR